MKQGTRALNVGLSSCQGPMANSNQSLKWTDVSREFKLRHKVVDDNRAEHKPL